MKILQKIEKRKETWFLLFTLLLFFLLRLPSLIEPYWYGDEGVYEVIGKALNNGRLLYSQIWDNKPPLLYIIYAIAHADQFTVRFLSLLFGIVSALLFYYLSQNLFRSHKISSITTLVYVLFFATPFLEGNIANAENFILLFTIASAFLVYKTIETPRKTYLHFRKYLTLNTDYLILFCSGILLGLAFLLKIVALFDFAAFFVFIFLAFLPEKLSIQHHLALYQELLKKLMYFTLGFLLPILVTVLYFLTMGTLTDFIQATFFSNIGYVGYQNNFIMPLGMLFLKLLALFTALALCFWKRKVIPQSILFIFLWFFFSIFNAFFSGRPWTHYLLVLLPSTVLLLGLAFDRKARKLKFLILGFLLFVIYSSTVFFKININTIEKTLLYYQNFALFITNNKSTIAYQEYFDRRVPRDYEVARFIAANTSHSDIIFVWGNNPQIYALSNTLPPGRYTVQYHISQSDKSIKETAEDIRRTKPKFIVILSEMPSFPFAIGAYENKFILKGADIYERTL
jgi:hypothetical protein